jgi:hypothetical protein
MGPMPMHRAVIRRPPDDSIAPPVAVDHHPTRTRRRGADFLLVIATLAIMLGLGALTASLTPFASDCMVVDRGHAPRPAPSRDGPVWPQAGEVVPAVLLRGSTGRQGRSSFRAPPDATTEVGIAHAGATASSRDPRAFLIDSAIQIHAPASAPAPRRRSAPPHPHGVD